MQDSPTNQKHQCLSGTAFFVINRYSVNFLESSTTLWQVESFCSQLLPSRQAQPVEVSNRRTHIEQLLANLFLP